MKTLMDYVNDARKETGATSDTKLCLKHIRINHTAVYMWRKRGVLPSDDVMIRLAKIGGNDPDLALIELNIWRSKEAAPRAHWQAIAKKLFNVAAAILLLVSVAVSGVALPTPANAKARA